MAETKFSQFTVGGEMQVGDLPVGLRPSSPTQNFQFNFPGSGIKDSSGNYLFGYSTVGSLAINYLQFINSSTGSPVTVTATGADPNINIAISPKGTGELILTSAALGTPVSGILTNCTGLPLSTGVTGILPFANGGTGANLTAVNSAVWLTDSAGNTTFSSSLANGELIIGSTGNTPVAATLTAGANITITNGPGTITISGTGGGSGVSSITGTTNQVLANGTVGTPETGAITLTLPQDIGTTSSPTFDAPIFTAPVLGTPASGTLTNCIGLPLSTGVTGILPFANGGTGGSLTPITSAIWLTDTSGNTIFSPSLTDGQIIIGSTGNIPVATTLTAGINITITNGPGSIMISGTGGGGGVSSITGTTNQVLANGTVGTPQTGAITLTLPQDIGTTSSPIFDAPSFTAPILGTPASGTLTNCTGLPLSTGVTGILPFANGGTGANLTAVNSAVWLTDSAGNTTFSSPLSNGQIIIGSTGNVPVAATLTAGINITITNGPGTITISGTGGGGGVSSITGTTNQVLANGTVGSPQTGAITLTLPQDIGTTSSPTFDAPIFTAPILGTPASGTLTNCTGLPLSTGVTGILPFANGGTGANLTAVNSAVWLTNTSGNTTFSSPLANGEIIIGSTGNTPVAATLTAGANITITNGPGTITISGTGGGSGVSSITGTTNQVLANGTVGSPQTGAVTLTLPQDIGTTSSPTFDAPIFTAPVLGTPASGTLTNCIGLPLSTGVTGILSFANGGTGANLTAVNSAVWLTDSSGNTTFSSSLTNGQIIIGSTGNTPVAANLTAGNNINIINSAGNISIATIDSPTFIAPILGTPASGTLTNCTGLPLSTGVTGILPFANGGTGANLTAVNSAVWLTNASGNTTFSSSLTDGQIIIGSTGNTPVAATLTAGVNITITNGPGTITISGTGGGGGVSSITGTTNQVLANGTVGSPEIGAITLTLPQDIGTTSSPTFDAPIFTAPVLGTPASGTLTNCTGLPLSTGVTGILPFANGGTGANLTAVNSAVWLTNASGNTTFSSSLTDGQIIIGSTGNTPVAATLTAGVNITITNGPGTITISGTGGGGGVSSITGTTNQVLANGTVGSPQTGAVTLTLPQDIGLTSSPTFDAPIFTAPVLGTPASGTLTNCTGLPLSTGVTGILPFTNGGTGANLTAVNSAVWLTNASGNTTFSSPLANGEIIIGSTGNTPVTTTLTAGTNISITNGPGSITISSTGGGAGVSSITGTANQVLADGTSGSPQTGAITLTLPQDIGTTSSPIFDAPSFTAPMLGTPASGTLTNCTGLPLSTGVTGILPFANGGTGSNLTAVNSAVWLTNSSGNTTFSSSLSNGEIIIGSTGNTPAVATLTAGSNITITNGPGSITISASGSGASSITGTANQVLANGTSGTPQTGAVTLTLPQDIATTSSPIFNAPSFTAPMLGTPASGTLTNCTGLPLSTGVTGILPFANGGTGANLTAVNSAVWLTNASGNTTFSSSLTNGQIIIGSTGNTPVGATLTAGSNVTITNGPGSITISATTTGGISSATGTNNQVLVNGTSGSPQTGAITLTLPQDIGLTSSPTFNAPIFTAPVLGTPASGTLTNCMGLPLSTGVTGILSLSNGGTAANLTASNGGIVYSNASSLAILAGNSTAGKIILSGASAAPSWSNATYPSSTTANQILFSSANNVISGLTSVNSSVLLTNASGVPTFSSSLTNGQIIIGSTGNTPAVATLTAGSNITITNSPGSITISASGSGTSSITGTANQVLANGTSGTPQTGAVTLTLPQDIATTSSPIFSSVQLGSKGILDVNGNEILALNAATSSVNYLTLSNGATGNSPTFNATGSDTNIITTINGKGTGGVNIKGTGTNNSAPSGYVGEFISSQITSSSGGVSFSSNTPTNLTSIVLTPGDWDVFGNVFLDIITGVGTLSTEQMGINIFSATLPDLSLVFRVPSGGVGVYGGVAPRQRILVSANTTVYLVFQATITGVGTTAAAYGFLGARRIR